MSGYKLTISTVPYSIFVMAEVNKDGPSHQLFVNHSGLEVKILETASQILNFHVGYQNPED
jgi:hypothetical protein